MKKDIKWISAVPLVGGMPIGNKMAFENDPVMFVSYPYFQGNDQHALNYFKDVPYYPIDIEANDVLEKDKTYKEAIKNVDFVSAVPPCAGLSMLNTGGSKNSSKKRGGGCATNDWMYHTSNYVLDNIKPKVLLFENAPGLYTKMGIEVKEKLQKIAKE